MHLKLNDLRTIRDHRNAALARDRDLRQLESEALSDAALREALTSGPALSPDALERLAFDLQRLSLPLIEAEEVETIVIIDVAGLAKLAGGAL